MVGVGRTLAVRPDPGHEAVARQPDAIGRAAGLDLVVDAVGGGGVADARPLDGLGRLGGLVGVVFHRIGHGREVGCEGHGMVDGTVEGDLLQVLGTNDARLDLAIGVAVVGPVGEAVARVAVGAAAHLLAADLWRAVQCVDALAGGAALGGAVHVAADLAVRTDLIGHGDVAVGPLRQQGHRDGRIVEVATRQVGTQPRQGRRILKPEVVDELAIRVFGAGRVPPAVEEVTVTREGRRTVLEVNTRIGGDRRGEAGLGPFDASRGRDRWRATSGVKVDDEVAARRPLGIQELQGAFFRVGLAVHREGVGLALGAGRVDAVAEPAQAVDVAGVVA